MEKVLGIAGFFFRALDPQGLAQWYEECLGVTLEPGKDGVLGWHPQPGSMPFNPSAQQDALAGNPDKVWMLSFRVRDMDAMVHQLRAKGVVVALDPMPTAQGLFARFADPEGNPVAIWEPVGVDARE